jgi:Fe2+ transport system protein FeoA
MLLSNLEINQEAQIKQINCGDELKQRFYSFVLIKGATISVDEISLARNTMAVNIDSTEIALRIEEEKHIEGEVL